jgi:hypothetical protein
MSLKRAVVTFVLIAGLGVLAARNLRAERQQNGQQINGEQSYSGEKAQVERGEFNEHDREGIRDWYRAHANQLEPANSPDRWSLRDVGAYLRVDSVLDEDTRRFAGPVPADLASQLGALPSGWRYVMLGYNVCIVDGGWTIRDVFHFDPFEDRDREAVHDWSQGHPTVLNRVADGGVNVDDSDLERRIQLGRIIDPGLRAEAEGAPDELVTRLSAVPVEWKYVVIVNRVCLVDKDWRVHEILVATTLL